MSGASYAKQWEKNIPEGGRSMFKGKSRTKTDGLKNTTMGRVTSNELTQGKWERQTRATPGWDMIAVSPSRIT